MSRRIRNKTPSRTGSNRTDSPIPCSVIRNRRGAIQWSNRNRSNLRFRLRAWILAQMLLQHLNSSLIRRRPECPLAKCARRTGRRERLLLRNRRWSRAREILVRNSPVVFLLDRHVVPIVLKMPRKLLRLPSRRENRVSKRNLRQNLLRACYPFTRNLRVPNNHLKRSP
jgi:hypothetical protein